MKYKRLKTYLLIKKILWKYKNFFLYCTFGGIFVMITLYTTLSDFSPKLVDSDVKTGWNENDMTDIEIFDFKTDYFKNDLKVWEMESKNARIYNKKDLTKLADVKIRYFENGAVDGEVEADTANMKNSTRSILMEGNVRLENSKGTVARGEQFRYNSRTGGVKSSKLVTITRPNGFKISGVGFSATANLENIVFYSGVSGEVEEETATSTENLNESF